MKRKAISPIPVLIAVLALLLIIIGYLSGQARKLASPRVTYYQPPPFVPTPTPIPPKQAPVLSGWKTYTDHQAGDFSFEYPVFMPEPVAPWPDEADVRIITAYRWAPEHAPKPDYGHTIEIRITGPYEGSAGKDLNTWLREDTPYYTVGTMREMAGYTTAQYTTLDGSTAWSYSFTEVNTDIPTTSTVQFKAPHGMYSISVDVTGTPDEIRTYQSPIYRHILSSFRFSK